MPKMGMAAFAAEIGEQIAAKSIHATCLIISLVPVPFILFYAINLKLLDGDLKFLFSGMSLTASLCIFICVSARVIAWLLYAVIVPGIAWLLYVAMHSLAWLLHTIIVPGTLWLLCVAIPALTRLLYAAVCRLTRQLQDLGRFSRALTPVPLRATA
jgi:hypothetical protein